MINNYHFLLAKSNFDASSTQRDGPSHLIQCRKDIDSHAMRKLVPENSFQNRKRAFFDTML